MATTAEINAFIKKLGALAVAESNTRIANGQGFVLPSVCIAQSALETGWGDSGLMTRANAYFGIKAGGSWTGAVYTADTWEVANGEAYNTSANFRAYSSLADSVKDYYDLIANNSRYTSALSFGTDQGAWKTPKECITAIWSGGYATDTLYVEKIMTTINARNLASWDRLIDGVSGVSRYDNYTFTKSDLLQGDLQITDSGRTISNVTSVLSAVALNWDKALTGAGSFKITGITSFTMHVARLIGDSPSIDTNTYSDGSTLTIADGEKVGFYLTKAGSGVLMDGVPDTIAITFTSTTTGDINNDPSYSEEIAYFVKIE